MFEILTIEFSRWWFFGIIPIYFLCTIYCKRKSTALLFSGTFLLAKTEQYRQNTIVLLKWGVVVLLSIALSSPSITTKISNKENLGYDIALIIDTSGSMQQFGFDQSNPKQNKLEALKIVADRFIEERIGDNLSLVVFGDFAYIASPLSFDRDALREILSIIDIGIAGEKTAIYDALSIGINSLKKGEAKSKIAILLTDGVNTGGSIPESAALEKLKESGIKTYTIGIGLERDFDKAALKNIANSSGGEFFHAGNAALLEQIYRKIDTLEKSKIKGEELTKREELFYYPLFFATLLLLFYIYFYNRTTV